MQRFIEPMLPLATEQLPSGGQWLYELKLDGFRAEAIKTGGRVHLRSRNDKDFNRKYPGIVKALCPGATEAGDAVILESPAVENRLSKVNLYSRGTLP